MSKDTTLGLKNLVVVGLKPIMNYVVACLTLFNAGMREICVRARGKHISKAVDTVEMLKRVFLRDISVKDISLGTEVLINLNSKEASVSTIEIRLRKPEASPY